MTCSGPESTVIRLSRSVGSTQSCIVSLAQHFVMHHCTDDAPIPLALRGKQSGGYAAPS